MNYPTCPICEMPMRLGLAEPLDEPGYERHIYECLSCKRSVNVVLNAPNKQGRAPSL
jgi:hypothetical protein